MAAEPIAGRNAGAAAAPRTGRARWALFVGLAVGVLVVDQIVKSFIAANFEFHRAVEIVGDYLRVAPTQNTGAIFGMFRDQAPIFALLSIGVMGLIVWYESRAGASLLVTLALGLLLGGALGNLTDRLRLGYVLDFMDLGIGDWRWYTFNVADAAISLSIVLLFVAALRPSSKSEPRPVEVRSGDG
jgi:signal peptidase II